MNNHERHYPMSVYTDHYQPSYPDKEAFNLALYELQRTRPVTTYENIISLREDLEKLATHQQKTPLIMAGPCAEHVRLEESEKKIATGYYQLHQIISQQMSQPISIIRGCGQAAKPRSREMEGDVYSYYGDMINGMQHTDRTPDPSRMVAAAIQSRDVKEYLRDMHGQNVATAHEVLLLPYAESFMMKHSSNDVTYLASSEMIWIGDRTRQPGSQQIKLLKNVINPIGIKIGPSATSADIRYLTQTLNPEDIPGKLSFIIRMGRRSIASAEPLLKTIKQQTSHSLIISDPCHGNTIETVNVVGNKQKTRVVQDMITEISLLSSLCQSVDLKLHGLHLETVALKPGKNQCVDEHGMLPNDKSDVDPQLNLVQFQHVLKETEKYLL